MLNDADDLSLVNKNDDIYSELLDSKYPLLQKFKEQCPGTYKHAQTMASMVEGVAAAIGLDVNEMKVVCLYHDVGKLFNPKAFTENQLDDNNIHDDLDPATSFQIITRHVSDTALILIDDPNFSKRLIRIVVQHHGNAVLKPLIFTFEPTL